MSERLVRLGVIFGSMFLFFGSIWLSFQLSTVWVFVGVMVLTSLGITWFTAIPGTSLAYRVVSFIINLFTPMAITLAALTTKDAWVSKGATNV